MQHAGPLLCGLGLEPLRECLQFPCPPKELVVSRPGDRENGGRGNRALGRMRAEHLANVGELGLGVNDVCEPGLLVEFMRGILEGFVEAFEPGREKAGKEEASSEVDCGCRNELTRSDSRATVPIKRGEQGKRGRDGRTDDVDREESAGLDAEVKEATVDAEECLLEPLAVGEELHVFVESRHRMRDGFEHADDGLQGMGEGACGLCGGGSGGAPCLYCSGSSAHSTRHTTNRAYSSM